MVVHTLNTKWGKTDQIIEAWVRERQEVLVLFYRLIKIHPYSDAYVETEQEVLYKFCQMLMDYVSAGHFEIFEKISEAYEYGNGSGLNRDLLVEILSTTIPMMDFSNKYAQSQDHTKLQQELSELGEALAKRMDLEDQLITDYLKATDALMKAQIRKTG